MIDTEIILASASPRRRELLHQIGLDCRIVPGNINENSAKSESPARFTELIAEKKATAVYNIIKSDIKNGIIIAADTVIVIDNEIEGKPESKSDAIRILKRLQGREHTVVTGLCLLATRTNEQKKGHKETRVRMCNITDSDIIRYVATGEPLDKAGAYGIQGLGAIFIDAIIGDYSNVVGLPLSLTAQFLRHFNVAIL